MAVEVSYALATPTEPTPEPTPQESTPSYGPEAYARMLKDLLPRGAAWLLDPGSWVSRVLLAIGDELARVDARVADLLRELDPRTALETLPDWERVLGLPDDCLTEIPDTASERQVAITQRLVSRGGQSRPFFIELAASLGYDDVTIHDGFLPLRAGFRAGDRCRGTAWAHVWQVNLPISAPGAGVYFRAGSRAGERLSGYGQLDVQCVFRHAAPAHTTVLFAYT